MRAQGVAADGGPSPAVAAAHPGCDGVGALGRLSGQARAVSHPAETRADRLRRFIGRHHIKFYWLIVGLAILYVAVVAYYSHEEPVSLTAITANTEFLEVFQSSADGKRFMLPNSWMTRASAPGGPCISGVFPPASQSTLQLMRQGA